MLYRKVHIKHGIGQSLLRSDEDEKFRKLSSLKGENSWLSRKIRNSFMFVVNYKHLATFCTLVHWQAMNGFGDSIWVSKRPIKRTVGIYGLR